MRKIHSVTGRKLDTTRRHWKFVNLVNPASLSNEIFLAVFSEVF